VKYKGGCEEHDYRLFWDGLIIETFPGSVDLVLFHDGNGDTCTTTKFERVVFDIGALGDGPLRVFIDGFDEILDLE
jgi:hypothetical protein